MRKLTIKRWHEQNSPLTSKVTSDGASDPDRFSLPNIELNILPRAMSKRFVVSSKVMGFAPGPERNGQKIFVLYDRVEASAIGLVMERTEGGVYVNPTTAQILGHTVAHELGHVLLNTESHSASGIMRGDWNETDLEAIAFERLLFTTDQAKVIHAEAARRLGENTKVSAPHRELGLTSSER